MEFVIYAFLWYYSGIFALSLTELIRVKIFKLPQSLNIHQIVLYSLFGGIIALYCLYILFATYINQRR